MRKVAYRTCKDYFVDVVGIIGRHYIYNLSRCIWNKPTGDVICSNYERSTNHGLNEIKSYLDFPIETFQTSFEARKCLLSLANCKLWNILYYLFTLLRDSTWITCWIIWINFVEV